MARALVVVLLVVLVLVALVAFGVLTLFRFGGDELKPVAVRMLHDADAGRVEEAWNGTSEAFRKAVPLPRFRAVTEGVRTSMGRFLEAGSVSGASVRTASGGPTTGETKAKFEFVKESDVWRVLGFEIPIPERLRLSPDRSRLEPTARGLLAVLQEGRRAQLYEAFAPELKEAWPVDRYEEDVDGLEARLGRPGEARLVETSDERDGRVRVRFDVDFEKGAGTALFTFVWRDARWDLLGLSLGPRE
jgi:hypothetical protein